MFLNVNILGHKTKFAPIQRYDAQSGPAQLGVVLVFYSVMLIESLIFLRSPLKICTQFIRKYTIIDIRYFQNFLNYFLFDSGGKKFFVIS